MGASLATSFVTIERSVSGGRGFVGLGLFSVSCFVVDHSVLLSCLFGGSGRTVRCEHGADGVSIGVVGVICYGAQ